MTREEAKAVLYEWQESMVRNGVPLDTSKVQALRVAIEALSERTGEWININTTNPPSFYHMGECSMCGAHGQITDNFCPNCGAIMVEKDGGK